MKKYLAVLFVVLLAAAYGAGYWPQRQRVEALESEVAGLREQLAEAEARVRLGALLGRLLALSDAIAYKNYGDALGLSSTFYEEVRAEAARTRAEFKGILESILARRDAMTVALTQGDPAALEIARETQVRLRTALSYPPPPAPPAPSPPVTPAPATPSPKP